ncbi:hypothetical protein F66182_8594 [Fusarium sp. NRRL 66182]|nr:hypothetical protein F66182_8594 [Fusarium sp. NRRL 66182]
MDKVKTWAGDLSGIRPGSNIEDVERSAIDHLFRGDKRANIHKATFTNAHHFGPRAPVTTPKDVLHATAHGEDVTFIDPITNRRVPKQPSMTGPAARYKDLEGYKPIDFVDVTIEADSAPKYDDLEKYKPIKDTNETEEPTRPKYDDLDKYEPKIDETSAPEKSVEYDDLDNYGPVKYNEPDGQRNTTPEEDSKKYDDLHKYSSTSLGNPFTQRRLTSEEQSKLYDDLDQYRPVHWNEPDGLRVQSSEELSKNYEDLHKYSAVHWNEPDGLRQRTPEELSKDYQDLDSYGPVVWSEPDGLRHLTPEENSKKYHDLHVYENPFEASKSTLEAHEKSQMDTTMRGKPLAPKVDAPVEDFASKYNDLHLYGPVRWNEPDGLRKLTPEELSKNYEDLHLYDAVRWNEPDGLRPLTAEEKSKRYHDTRLYAARDVSPHLTRVHPEEASKAYKDLPGYRHFDNADATSPRVHPEESSKQYTDLNAYSAFKNDGPETERVHPEQTSKDYEDLTKYPTAGFEETIRVQHIHPEELTKNYTDLGSYKPSGFVSQAQAYPINPEEASKVYQDLDRYTAVRYDEPNGKMSVPLDEVARGLREFDSKAGSQDSPGGPSNTYHRTPNRSSPDSTETSVDNVESGNAEEIRAAVLRRAHEMNQDKLTENDDQRPPIANAAADSKQSSDTEPRLTGNYARDFPEEFVASWSTSNSPSKSTMLPNNHADESSLARETSSANEDSVEPGSMDESFPLEDVKLQPALDRCGSRAFKDLYSHSPQGLQTSFSEECGQSTMPVLEKHYTSKKPEAANEAETPKRLGTASYKILAFNPASQMMSVAEATSAIGGKDTATSLSDALLQLDDPAKFLPFFKSLKAKGYEVVSGSSNVLICRKMHPGTTSMDAVDGGSFDMPDSGNGNFIAANDGIYDMSDRKKCRTKEGARTASHASRQARKKRGVGRKILLGTAGIAGSVYAATMLAEYFSTKGLGPKSHETRRP